MNQDLIPIRRYVDADNSCLFSSIAYLIDPKNFSETSSYKYRYMIAEYLMNNKLNDVILDKPQNEYIEEIQNIKKWGGAIELRLFSDIFKIKIGSIDVMSNRIDIYGETNPYNKIIYVLYNGVHYDPLVMNFSADSSKESDITKFDSMDDNILINFRKYAEIFKDSGDFVDLANLMSFQCEICNQQFQSQDDMSKHAQNSDHWEFKQI